MKKVLVLLNFDCNGVRKLAKQEVSESELQIIGSLLQELLKEKCVSLVESVDDSGAGSKVDEPETLPAAEPSPEPVAVTDKPHPISAKAKKKG